LGGWFSDVGSETGLVIGFAAICTADTEDVVAVGTLEVVVKEPKQISTGLARMAAMLTGKTTPDRATNPPCCTASSRSPLRGAPTVKG
jgi:hypothetical protein